MKLESKDEIIEHWSACFKNRGLFPKDPGALIESSQYLGTWVARNKGAVASASLWDTGSQVNFVTTSLGWRARITTILMSLWAGHKLPTKAGESLRSRTLIGLFADGERSKRLMQGLVYDISKICYEEGTQLLLCPLDISSTRQYALPYWRSYGLDILTAAKRFEKKLSGKVQEVRRIGLTQEEEELEEQRRESVGYVGGFIDPRFFGL